MRLLVVILFVLVFQQTHFGQTDRQKDMLRKINKVRKKGCYCGTERMPPVKALSWNRKLRKSAYLYAKDMYENSFFSHYSTNGETIDHRITNTGYKWSYIGENLGLGQKSFDQVLKDWLESPSHCKMIMSPKVSEIGVARKKQLWVSHFGMPYEAVKYYSN